VVYRTYDTSGEIVMKNTAFSPWYHLILTKNSIK
jgi:hypothetical protein